MKPADKGKLESNPALQALRQHAKSAKRETAKMLSLTKKFLHRVTKNILQGVGEIAPWEDKETQKILSKLSPHEEKS